MKKKMKAICSLLFVLALMLQLAGGMAFANNDAVSGEESLVFDIQTLEDDQSAIVTLGDKNAAEGPFTLKDLMTGDLVVTPPEGYKVSALYLLGAALGEDDKPISLDPIAVLPNGGEGEITSVTVSKDSFIAEPEEDAAADAEPVFDTQRLSTRGESYNLVIRFAKLDSEAPITLSYDLNGVSLEGFEAQTGEKFTVKALSADDQAAAARQNKRFGGWALVYPNGSSVPVDPNTEIAPYESATLRANWIEVVNVSPKAAAAQAGQALSYDMLDYENSALPQGTELTGVQYSVSNADGSLGIGDTLAAGEYAIRVVGGRLVEKDSGKDVDPAVAELNLDADAATLTVTAAPEEKQNEEQPATDIPYPVLEGADAQWTQGSAEGLTFRIDADFSKFKIVKVDDETLAQSVYTAQEGSTVITLSGDYLKSLAVGGHKLTVLFSDGKATADFNIMEAPVAEKTDLTVKVKDTEADYSGSAVTVSDYEITAGALKEGHSLAITAEPADAVNAGSYTLSIKAYTVKDAEGNDISDQYNVTTADGKLTIKPLAVTFKANDLEKTYSGTAFSFANDYKGKITASGQLSGHTVSANLYLAQNGSEVKNVTAVGSYDIMLRSFTVKSGDTDLTANYSAAQVGTKLATLTIVNSNTSEIPVTITVKDNKWTYDGKAHTVKDYEVTGLVDGDKIDVTFANNTITDAGTYHVIQSYKITNNGSAVGDKKYKVTVEDTVTVEKFTITLTAESASKTYDGKALKNDNVKASAIANSSHKLTVKFAVKDSKGNIIKSGPVDVGTYTKTITEVTVKDGSTDVTKNYDIKTVDGTLTITKANGSTTTSQNNSTSPKTGDENNMSLWIGLLALSAVLIIAVIVIIVLRNKKRAK